MSEQPINKTVDDDQKIIITLKNIGIFKISTLDESDFSAEGFCDQVFFTVKSYNPEIAKKIKAFKPVDNRLKIRSLTGLLDGVDVRGTSAKVKIIIKEIGELAPNPKKEKL